MKRLTATLLLCCVLSVFAPAVRAEGGGPEIPPAPTGGGPEIPPTGTTQADSDEASDLPDLFVDALLLLITLP